MTHLSKDSLNRWYQHTFTTKYGIVLIKYEVLHEMIEAAFGPGVNSDKLLRDRGPEALPYITSKLEVSILSRDRKHKQTAHFEAWEAANLFQGEWPCDSTFSYLSQTVRDRRD
jgi:hypothetical protein